MYIGVKYIGKNESKEDTICNTGAVWTNGEVFNFEEESAKKLAVHTDSFQLVDMSPDVKTYSNKQVNAVESYEPFPSLATMDKEQIAALASVRYGIKIDIEGREKDEVMFDALNRIKAASLRADATALGTSILPVVSLTVTEDEYKGYIAGKLELKLLPVGAKAPQMLSEVDQAEAVAALLASAPVIAPDVNSGRAITAAGSGMRLDDAFDKVNKEIDHITLATIFELRTDAENKAEPTLPELLASLSSKKDLQDLAKENGVSYANSMTEAQLRAKLLRELTK